MIQLLIAAVIQTGRIQTVVLAGDIMLNGVPGKAGVQRFKDLCKLLLKRYPSKKSKPLL